MVAVGPTRVLRATTEGAIAELVRAAAEQGRVVRVRGSGHSVPEAINAGGDGLDVTLTGLRSVSFDDSTMQVTVGAGCNLGIDPRDPTSTADNSLLRALDRRGWALPDLGGISPQTVGGFLSTGSTGGSVHHSLADQIVAIRVVDGRGRVQELRRDTGDARFWAVGCSLGLLGVIVAVTFQCVPAFLVAGTEATTSEDDCAVDLFGADNGRPSLAEFVETADYSRILWWPQAGVRRVLLWQAARLAGAAGPAASARAEIEPYETFPSVAGSTIPAQAAAATWYSAIRHWNSHNRRGALTRAALRRGLAPFVRLFAELDGGEPTRFRDLWWRGLPMDDGVSDRVMPTEFTELWLPLETTTEVMRRLRAHFGRGGLAATGPFAWEIYAARRSPFWLSPAHDRDAIRIDPFWFTRFAGDPVETWFPQLWELLEDLGPRLHWGKLLPTDAAERLRDRYSQWEAFMRIRDEMDPAQVFVNPYWREHLGIRRADG